MKRITDLVIKFIPFLLILTSCGERRVMKDLSDIEFYIDARPDSALIALRQIDTTILGANAAKAKFMLWPWIRIISTHVIPALLSRQWTTTPSMVVPMRG